MDVTPQELRSSEIKDSWRGYDRDEVDDLLERAAVTIEGLNQQLQEGQSRPVPAAPVAEAPLPSSRDDADMLQRTLLLAQRAADDAVNEAQARAKQMLDESEAKAQALVSDAEATARRIAEGERRRLEGEILELSSRRDQLRVDADALDEYASGYRDRIRAAIEHDLANLGETIEPPSERPELHEVEVPAEREPAPSATDTANGTELPPSAPGTPGGDSAWDAGPATRSIGAFEAEPAGDAGSFPSEASGSRAPVAAPVRTDTATAWPPAPEARAGAPTAESSWLSAGDDWSTTNAEWDAPAPWEQRDGLARPEPDSYASEIALEANPVDTDSLDDEAFFASLREAVRDDAPLGPRDEETEYYDAESEQDRRRFRRRR